MNAAVPATTAGHLLRLGAIVLLAACAPVQSARSQDVAAGERAFNQYCRPCHAVGPGAVNRAGPVLDGVIGNQAGSVAGFDYSDDIRRAGVVWTESRFVEYIRNPAGTIPGTRKIAVSVRSESTLKNIYRYLERLDAAPDRAARPRP